MKILFLGAENPRTARKGWLFLVSALLFLAFAQLPPPYVRELGLLGTAPGLRIAPHYLSAGVGLALVFGCCHFLLDLVLRQDGWRYLLSGWPSGGLRRIPWHRILAALGIGLCLSSFSQHWIALAFAVTLLQFSRDARRLRTANLRKLADLLSDLKTCWLGLVLGQAFFQPSNPPTPLVVALSLSFLVLAVSLQIHPRFSFTLCFFRSKSFPQFTMERCLWSARLERIVVSVLALASLSQPSLLPLLAPFCAGRVLFVLALKSIYADQNWSDVLRSKTGPWCVQLDSETRGMVPDQASLSAFCPKQNTYARPLDRFGHGPLTTTVSPYQGLGYAPRYALPIEALTALFLFFFGLAAGTNPCPLNSAERVWLTCQTRAVEVANQTVLFHAGGGSGPSRLLENLPYQAIIVQASGEFLVISSAILLLAALACYFRWRSTLLGMWCHGRFGHKYDQHLVCMSLILAFGVTAWLDWFWFPLSAPFLCLALLTPQRHLAPSEFPSTGSDIVAQLKRLLQSPLEEERKLTPLRESWESFSLAAEIKLEVGRRLLFLVEPRNGVPFIKPEAIGQPFREKLGFELPQIHCRDYLKLEDREYRLLINDVPVLGGSVFLPFAASAHNLPQADRLLSEAQKEILEALTENAHLLVNRMTVERILRAATASHPRLVQKVRERHTPTTVKQVLKALVHAGYSLNKTGSWLTVLATSNGSPDELTREILCC